MPSLASTAEVMTKRKIAHRVKNALFNLIGFNASGCQPMKKLATCTTVSIGFREVRCVGVNSEDHVGSGSVKSYCCGWMGGKVVKELVAFFHH